MHPALPRLAGGVALATSLALAACSSTNHPEYHPVTVTHFSQNIAYPVSVSGAPVTVERGPVTFAPTPQATVLVPELVGPREAPPPDFFR